MDKKEYSEHNIEKLIHLHGSNKVMDESRKKQILVALMEQDATNTGKIKSAPLFSNYRKLAFVAAGIIIFAATLIYFFASSNRKIKIPPALTQLSIEQLIELHYEPSKSPFDADIVKAALQQALGKFAPEEVIKIAKSLAGIDRGIQVQLAAPPVHPVNDFSGYPRKTFPEIVEGSNLFVHARLTNININVDDIIRALIEKEQFSRIEDSMSNYRVTIQLEVIDTLPRGSLKANKIITVPAVLAEDQLNRLTEDSEYFFAMVQDEVGPRFLEYFSGVYPVDYNNPASNELWRFFSDAQDILLFGNHPKQETIDYWISKLNGETFLLTLEYMDTLPNELVPASPIMDAIELRYRDLISRVERDIDEAGRISNNNMPLFEKGMNLLLRSDDKDSINRMLSLFNEDTVLGEVGILWRRIHESNRRLLSLIVRLVIASEENDLSDRLIETYIKYKDTPLVISSSNTSYLRDRQIRFVHSLLAEIIDQAGAIADEDIMSMLLGIIERLSGFGLYDAPTFGKIWRILASSKDYDMRSYLEEFIADPNLSDISVFPPSDKNYSEYSQFEFERAAFQTLRPLPGSNRPTRKELLDMLLVIYKRNEDNRSCLNFTVNTLQDILRPEDTECIPILTEMLLMDEPHWAVPSIIAQRMPDPSLVPVVRTAMEREVFESTGVSSLIEALFVCGAKDEAITKALGILAKPLREDTSSNLYRDINRNASIVLFLGRTQRDYLIPIIEEYTQQKYIEKYREVFAGLDNMRMDFCLDQLRQNAIMAFARLGGKSSITRLRQLYDSHDIRVRIVAALALYYNGDKTGERLLRHFVEGTHRSFPEIEIRWHVDLAGGTAFQSVINSYLRSELTDALLLEKLTYYVDNADTNIESSFFKGYKREILGILIEQLNSSNRSTRGHAHDMLQKATGQNFGFQPDRYAGQQEEAIQRWRAYITKELATATLPGDVM